jgi:hypothetical protein
LHSEGTPGQLGGFGQPRIFNGGADLTPDQRKVPLTCKDVSVEVISSAGARHLSGEGYRVG